MRLIKVNVQPVHVLYVEGRSMQIMHTHLVNKDRGAMWELEALEDNKFRNEDDVIRMSLVVINYDPANNTLLCQETRTFHDGTKMENLVLIGNI